MPAFSSSNLWQRSADRAFVSPALDGDFTCDLLIIGGGFTGCAAALEAAQAGASVVVLEARTIGHGGSGRNVGLVNAGLWLPPDEIRAQMGDEAALRLIQRLGQAPQQVFDVIARENISCEATRNGTLHLAHSPSGLKDLETRFRQGNQLGAPLALLDADETTRRMGTDRFHGALFDPRAGTIQPLAYCRGLAQAARRQGAVFYENTPVTALSQVTDQAGQTRGIWQADTAQGRLRAPKLLLATGAYLDSGANLPAPEFVPVSYSQFATAPLPQRWLDRILPGKEGCWDTATVMTSFRLDQAGRLMLGTIGDASDENLLGAGGLHRAWALRKLRQIFPDLAAELPRDAFEHIWQGRIAMTHDHIPKVQRIGENGFAIFGYSGRGIGPGTVFGTAAARALLTGDTSCWPLPVVDQHRERLAKLSEVFYEAGALARHILPVP